MSLLQCRGFRESPDHLAALDLRGTEDPGPFQSTFTRLSSTSKNTSMHDGISGHHAKKALDTLLRYLRGDAHSEELSAAASALDSRSIVELCRHLAVAFEGWLQVDLRRKDIAGVLRSHLDGKLPQADAALWASCAHVVLSSSCVLALEDAEPVDRGQPTIPKILQLLSFLLDQRHSAPFIKTRSALLRILKTLEEGRPLALRTFLPSLFQDMGTLRFFVVENPLGDVLESGSQWVDVGLAGPTGEEVRFIPFSIFTRKFFLDRVPELASSGPDGRERGDPFPYHPENNQALSLLEAYPKLHGLPVRFQYFVDESGLAEVIFETQALDRDHVRLAAKLFCLQNHVRRAMLDGRRVSCAQGARWR